MGCDGGTIPKRDELVRTKKKPEQKDKASETAFRWKSCALSQQPLQTPVVACELGRMYNKDAIIEELLEKSSGSDKPISDVVSHLKSIRDVKDLKLTDNPSWTNDSVIEKGDGYIDNQKSQWICPVTGQEMSGRLRFTFIWTCGCVISERAIKQTATGKKNSSNDKLECLKCQKPFSMDDVILINPVEEDDVQQAWKKMDERRERIKNEKKSKKQNKAKASATVTSATIGSEEKINGEKVTEAAAGNSTTTTTKLSFSATITGKRSDSKSIEEASNGPSTSKKSRLVVPSSKPKSLESSSSEKAKLNGTYSVATDRSASETYKSLFTTHSTAKQQDKAHWVTYNPFYN